MRFSYEPLFLSCQRVDHRNSGTGPRGVLGMSSDGVERRIFGGLKFLIPGFFWGGKFGKYFFGKLDLSRDFFGVFLT